MKSTFPGNSLNSLSNVTTILTSTCKPILKVRKSARTRRAICSALLSVDEARALLDIIDVSSPVGLRDRALIGLMVYTFARVGAAIKIRVKDVYVQGRRTWVRLHEKGGKRHEMPCHHNLDEYLQAYIEGAQIGADAKGYLFRTALGRTRRLSDRPMHQADVYRMIRRRAEGCGGTYEDRLSQLPRDGDHGISAKRRQARGGAANGKP